MSEPLSRRSVAISAVGAIAALNASVTAMAGELTNTRIRLETPGASIPAKISDELAFLIDTHTEAFQAYLEVLDFSDDVALGREPTEEEVAVFKDAEAADKNSLTALCRYSCTSMREVDAKCSYIHELTNRYYPLTSEQHDAIIRSMARTAVQTESIEWVRQMRNDGHVFVCRGNADNLNDYTITKDRRWGDDSEILIAHMMANAKASEP